MADVVMVGSVALDSVETPAGRAERALGGAACYAGVAASFFTAVKLVGVVGEDFDPAHLAFLASRGIDTAGIERVPGKTFFWAGRYSNDMNDRVTLTTELNVFEQFDPALPAAYRSVPYLFLANIQPGLQLKVLDQMTRPRFVALDTMNLWIEHTPDELRAVIARVDLLLLNDSEARQLTGKAHLPEAGFAMLGLGPRVAVVKKGEHGAVVFTRDGMFLLPAYPVPQVTDPTGCGDVFAGGLVGYLAAVDRSDDAALRRAAAYGTVLASFNVEDFSLDRLRTLTREEVEERYLAFHGMTQFGLT
ncbi:MAG: sugar kinase [Armatimonadetes bacterium]|nr:sugar kinase [Armatimonadota bacterium]